MRGNWMPLLIGLVLGVVFSSTIKGMFGKVGA